MADLIDLYNFSMKGAEEGKARGIQSLIGRAAANPAQRQQFLGMAAQSDPRAAFDAQKYFADDDGRKRTEVAKRVSVLMSMPQEQRAQMYASMAPEFQAMGIPAPAQYDPSFDEPMRAIAATYGTGEQGAPTGYRQFELTANAAGLKPSSPEYQRAARVALGLEGRASSAGAQTFEMPDENGVPTRFTFNPRTGSYEKALLGGAPQMPDADPVVQPGGDLFAGLPRIPGVQVTSALRSPERNARVGGVDNSFHLQPGPAGTGMARDILPPQTPEQAQAVRQYAAANNLEVIDEGDHWHLEPRGGQGRPITGRRKEDEAAAVTAATEQAKINAQIASYDRMTGLEADRAGRVASATATGKEQAEVAAKAATRVRDAQQTLGLLDEAERLLQTASGGRLEAGRDAVAGAFNVTTEGAKATASLKLIAADLVSKVPRFEGPQSNIDVQFYREAAGDLANDQLPVGQRLAALQTMRRLRQKYAGQGQPKRAFSQQEVVQKISEARQAIQRGADPEAVKRRLIEMGLQNAAGRL